MALQVCWFAYLCTSFRMFIYMEIVALIYYVCIVLYFGVSGYCGCWLFWVAQFCALYIWCTAWMVFAYYIMHSWCGVISLCLCLGNWLQSLLIIVWSSWYFIFAVWCCVRLIFCCLLWIDCFMLVIWLINKRFVGFRVSDALFMLFVLDLEF